jgi:hypothetical protein
MTRYERELQVKEYTLNTWENAFTVFVEGEEVHGTKAVERAIKVMNAIDPDFTNKLINDEVSATIETSANVITVYHGTHENLTTFINREVKNYDSIGTYFTSNKQYANMLYGKNVVAANITLNNPLIVNNVNDLESFDKVFYDRSLTTVSFSNINKLLLDTNYINALRNKLINDGYDGIVFQDSRIDLAPGDKESHSVYIVFNTNNVQVIQ